jgi:hypothetical protein
MVMEPLSPACNLSLCAGKRMAPKPLGLFLFLARYVDRELHPLASLLELCLLLRRQILPVFERVKRILGIGAPLSRAIPGCVFASHCISATLGLCKYVRPRLS